ncbi:hypothetical protein HHX47_DHR5001049 [Lentinula edodes]|nr:hypothetical protein HHX47_DHR5001049 [Lentinula edodes]
MRSSDIRRNDSKSSTHPLNSPRRKSRMPSLFNSLRGGIYVAAILFTVICLAMAGHFEAVLASSDLTLGIYLASSDSQSADVECFASATSTQVLDDSSASFLIFAFGLFLLALRRHRKGDEHMWYGPVTSCAWFNEYSKRRDRVKRSQSGILPVETVVPVFTEKPSRRSTRHRSQSRGHSRGHPQSHRHRREPTTYPARVYQSQMNSKYVPKEEPQSSGSSLLASTTESFDNGTMKNPNRR